MPVYNVEDRSQRGLAVCERHDPSGSCRRLASAGGSVQQVQPSHRERGPHGRRIRHARNPHHHLGREGGDDSGAVRREVPSDQQEGHRGHGDRVQSLQQDPLSDPYRDHAEALPRPPRPRLHLHQGDRSVLLPEMRQVPSGPLRGGRMPQVRSGEDPQRSVRRLRNHLRDRRPAQTVLHPVRIRARDKEHRALLPQAQRLQGAPPQISRGQGLLEGQRQGVHQELAGGRSQRQGHHPRYVLGRPHPGRRLGRQGDLRLVRGGHRLSQRIHRVLQDDRQARLLGGVLEGSGGEALLLHRKGQHPVPFDHLARHPHGRRRTRPPLRHPRQRVSDDQRREALQEP